MAISVNKWGYNAIETLNEWIKLLSQIFPENDKAETVAQYSADIYDLVQSRVAELPDVYKRQMQSYVTGAGMALAAVARRLTKPVPRAKTPPGD